MITITITITVIREIRLRSFHIRTDLWKFGFFYCDLLTNQFRRHGAFSGARSAPHTRDRARGDSPTSARRTGRVCPVAVRPRVPPCAGERSERPIWIPAHRASCRGDSTLLSRTFQTLLRLRSREGGGKRGKKSVKDDFSFTRACRLEDHFVPSPFPKLSAAVWLPSWNVSPVTA